MLAGQVDVSIVDQIIKHDIRRQTITIVRTSAISYGVVEITGLDTGRRRLDPAFDFEYIIRMPSDSGVIAGDMLLINNGYYLVMAVERKIFLWTLGLYKMTTYKCNSIVSIFFYDATTKQYTNKTAAGVHCLITQARATEWPTDKAVITPQYRGRHQPFQLYIQDSSGIVSGADCIIVDQESRRFRISKQVDVFVADGISRTEVLWER